MTLNAMTRIGRLKVASHCENSDDHEGAIFKPFPVDKTPREAVTEEDLIHPVAHALGWTDCLL